MEYITTKLAGMGATQIAAAVIGGIWFAVSFAIDTYRRYDFMRSKADELKTSWSKARVMIRSLLSSQWPPVLILLYALLSHSTPPQAASVGAKLDEGASEQAFRSETPATYQYRNEMTVAQTSRMIEGMRSVVRSRAEWLRQTTIVLTAPPGEEQFASEIMSILEAGCRICEPSRPNEGRPPCEADSICMFQSIRRQDPHDLDAPKIPAPTRAGIIVHYNEPIAPENRTSGPQIAAFLGQHYLADKTKEIPSSIRALLPGIGENLIWIEVGRGAPWDTESFRNVEKLPARGSFFGQ